MWWLTQFRRWGMVDGTPDYEGVAAQVMRPDLYEEAMKELGVAHGGAIERARDAVRRHHVRPGEAGGLREVVRDPQHEGLRRYRIEAATPTDLCCRSPASPC